MPTRSLAMGDVLQHRERRGAASGGGVVRKSSGDSTDHAPSAGQVIQSGGAPRMHSRDGDHGARDIWYASIPTVTVRDTCAGQRHGMVASHEGHWSCLSAVLGDSLAAF